MDRIWANRLEAGDQVWSSVPLHRRANVNAILKQDVADERIPAALYEKITGEKYPEVV